MFKNVFIFNWRITVLWWFLSYLPMSQPWVYRCALSSEPPSHLPLHPTPLGCPRAWDSSSLHHTASSHWISALHTVKCMFPSPFSLSYFHTFLTFLPSFPSPAASTSPVSTSASPSLQGSLFKGQSAAKVLGASGTRNSCLKGGSFPPKTDL